MCAEKLTPRGQDSDDAIRQWSKDEITNGPTRGYDLGKFFFAVSIGTISIFIGIAKFDQKYKFDFLILTSAVLFLVSIASAINMVRPRIKQLGGDLDLYYEYKRRIQKIKYNMWIWLISWLLGLLFGCFSLL